MTVCQAQEDKALYQTIWGKGRTHLNLSVPFINYIHSRPQQDYYGKPYFEQTGILGFSVGADYCNNERRFMSFQVGVMNGTLPVERFSDTSGWEYAQSAVSFFVNARQNHTWKRFDFGYGPLLSYHSVRFGKYNQDLNIDSTVTHSNWALGGSCAAYFRIVYFLYAGVLYQPQFISLSHTPALRYEHTLSLDVMFRMNVSKSNKQ